jgi:hypothetical protein
VTEQEALLTQQLRGLGIQTFYSKAEFRRWLEADRVPPKRLLPLGKVWRWWREKMMQRRKGSDG